MNDLGEALDIAVEAAARADSRHHSAATNAAWVAAVIARHIHLRQTNAGRRSP